MAAQREKYTNVHRRRGTGWEANTLPMPCVEFCTEWHPSETGDTLKLSQSDPRRNLFPAQFPLPNSGTSPNLAAPSISPQNTRIQALPLPRRTQRAGTRDGLRSPFHACLQTPWQMSYTSAKRWGIVRWAKREKDAPFNIKTKEGSQEILLLMSTSYYQPEACLDNKVFQEKAEMWALEQWPQEIPALCPGDRKKNNPNQHITYHLPTEAWKKGEYIAKEANEGKSRNQWDLTERDGKSLPS